MKRDLNQTFILIADNTYIISLVFIVLNVRDGTGSNFPSIVLYVYFRHYFHMLLAVYNTLVNVYVDLVVFTRIAVTSKTGSGRYWWKYYIEKHVICLKDYRIRSFLSIQYVHGDLCKHLGIDSSTDLNDLIL